jgi:hypothetical protein
LFVRIEAGLITPDVDKFGKHRASKRDAPFGQDFAEPDSDAASIDGGGDSDSKKSKAAKKREKVWHRLS